MTAVLVVLAIIIGLVGAIALTQATLGVGLIALSILLAILARMNQSGEQAKRLHKELWAIYNSHIDTQKGPLSPAP